MNSHEPAGEERTGGFEGRVGGAELGDSQQVGVHVLKGGKEAGGGRGKRQPPSCRTKDKIPALAWPHIIIMIKFWKGPGFFEVS